MRPLGEDGRAGGRGGALPKALVKLGHQVQVFIPYYRQVAKLVPNAAVVLPSVTIPFPSYNRFVRILDGGIDDGVQYYFVDCPELFDRESSMRRRAATMRDNAERFGLLRRAVIEATKMLGVPDVFHVHDWQTAMLAVLLRSTYYFDPVLRHVPAVLTIHNAGYQGWFPPRTMETLLLPWDMFTMEKLEQYDTVNFLKGGIVYADALTTVSRGYAKEIQTPEFGNGLEGCCGGAARIWWGSSMAWTTTSGIRRRDPLHRGALYGGESRREEGVPARSAACVRHGRGQR